MGNTLTDEGAGLGGENGGVEQKPVGKALPARRGLVRRVAEIQIDGSPVKIWLKDNTLHFRIKRRRKVTTLSLPDAYDFSRGQTQFFYGKGD